jgi:hypothetical protein
MLDLVSEHAFMVHIRRPGQALAGPMDHKFAGQDSDELPVIAQPHLEPGTSYPVAAIMAPVYDRKSKVNFALLLAGFHNSMDGAEAMEAGRRLAEACERISTFLIGKPVEA